MTPASEPESPPREFAEIVGREFVCLAGEADAVDGVPAKWVVEPGTPSEVARVLAAANAAGLSVIPRGGGTKPGWGNPPRSADVILSLRRLDQVLEHAWGDMTATVEAGCAIGALQRTLAERGQRLALDPLWPEAATVGGVLATAESGPLRWAYGPPRDLVLGVTVALADGTLARSGGKVVKNVAGYDLPKLFTGSFGTLGVITQATFRLHPLPAAVRDLTFAVPAEGVERFLAASREWSLITAAVQIRGDEDGWTACVRVEGLSEAITTKADRVTQAALSAGARPVDVDAAAEWAARERLFEAGERPSAVCKVGVLPARLHELGGLLRAVGSGWSCVLQAYGAGLVRVEAADVGQLRAAVTRLREGVASIGGTAGVLGGPVALKAGFDVWGEAGSSLPLMRRVKEQFDPAGILNPGRFVGGI
jgi:glycolate oxidase FAD binding subunit